MAVAQVMSHHYQQQRRGGVSIQQVMIHGLGLLHSECKQMGEVMVGVQKLSSFVVGLATPLQLSVTLFCMGVNAEKSGVLCCCFQGEAR